MKLFKNHMMIRRLGNPICTQNGPLTTSNRRITVILKWTHSPFTLLTIQMGSSVNHSKSCESTVVTEHENTAKRGTYNKERYLFPHNT